MGNRSDLPEALDAALAQRDSLAQELFEAHRFAAELNLARQALTDRLATVEAAVRAEAARLVDAAHHDRDQAIADRDAARLDRDAARAAERDSAARLARVTGSTAWRITAPLRHGLIRLLGRPRDDA